ncbi:hypothetical protein FACS189440_07220 [Bacteroidia bacterium]|nr:hypothetical protein FACS189440_07220 [Bacteroidia bacterium]
MNAQVNIGSPDAPHKGAVLDLSQGSGDSGLLLPKVSFSTNKPFQLPEDPDVDPIGMVVYNTNPALGIGLYTWNGTEWESVGTGIGGSTGSGTPVSVTSSTITSGLTSELKVEVTAGTPPFTYNWYKQGSIGIVHAANNTTATSDSYTIDAPGNYICQVYNNYTTTPVNVNFMIAAASDGSQEVYNPVGDGTLPDIYVNGEGEVVSVGPDGIPGTADDDTFTPPVADQPRPANTTPFIIGYISPRPEAGYKIQVEFSDPADQAAYDAGTLKLGYFTSDPNVAVIDKDGIMTVTWADLDNNSPSTIISVITSDGSISTRSWLWRASLTSARLGSLQDATISIAVGGATRQLGVTTVRVEGVVGSVYDVASYNYEIAGNSLGSTVTPLGLFTPGNQVGDVTVTVTATKVTSEIITGTITVQVIEPVEKTPEPIFQTSYPTPVVWEELESAPAFAGGTGEANSPYLISSIRQLKLFAEEEETYGKYYKLTADLDFAKVAVNSASLVGSFQGTFDGNGHVIWNLTINLSAQQHVGGIFGSISYGEVKNLGREGGSTSGNNYIGSIAYSMGGKAKLTNCYNTSNVTGTNSGGLVCTITGTGATIDGCYNSGNISGRPSGGLVSYIQADGGVAIIKNSYNSGPVSGRGVATYYIGGIVGSINLSTANRQQIFLENVTNYGTVTRIDGSVATIGAIIGGDAGTSNNIVTFTNVKSKAGIIYYGDAVQPDKGIGDPGSATWKGVTTFGDFTAPAPGFILPIQ